MGSTCVYLKILLDTRLHNSYDIFDQNIISKLAVNTLIDKVNVQTVILHVKTAFY